MDHTPKARTASQRTKTKTLKAAEWEENQTYLTSIEYEADRLMAQQMHNHGRAVINHLPGEIRSVLSKKVIRREEEKKR